MAAPRHDGRAYRRLLFCYPRAYRRERGEEMVQVLLEGGRGRPSFAEAANLIAHGLRARLGRPVSRSVVVWAVFTTVACGVFGAAFGQRLGWMGERPPTRAEAISAIDELLPGKGIAEQMGPEAPALFTVYEEPLTTKNFTTLLIGDGGEYQLAQVRASVYGPAGDADSDLTDLRLRLAASGWAFREYVRPAAECIDATKCNPDNEPQKHTLYAGRGDRALEIGVYPSASGGESYLWINLSRAAPSRVHLGSAVGGVLGAMLGFLVFGWASRRTQGRRASLAVGLFALMTFLWWAPIVFAFPFSVFHHVSEWHYRAHPLWEWLGQPAFLPFLVLGSFFALACLGVAAFPQRAARPARDTVAT